MTASQTPFILILLPPASSMTNAKRSLPLIPGANAQVLSSRMKHRNKTSSHTLSSTASSAPTSSVSVTPYLGTVFSTSLCLQTKEACEEYTSVCGGKGQCGETKRAGKSCWTCSCGTTKVGGSDVRWSGVGCEKRDVSE